MNCDGFRDLMPSYLNDTLGGGQRKIWRSHLASCPSCSQWAVALEPTLMFSVLRTPPPDPAAVDACSAAVTAMIRQQQLGRRLPSRNRPWLAAAAAVLLTTAGSIAWWLSPTAGSETPAAMTSLPTAVESTAPEVEIDMEGEGIRVYHFATDGDNDTTVAFIINPALES